MTAELSTVRRVIGYGRQSAAQPGETEKTSLSLDAQETRFLAWCREHDATSVGFIRDHDLSGDDPTRPGIRELLDSAERQRPDAVWVLTMARFSRDFVFQELTWRDLQKRGVQRLISDIESHTDDDMVRGIYGLISAKQLKELKAHLKATFHQRAVRGEHHGEAPYGYRRAGVMVEARRDGTTHERATGPLEPDPATRPIVEEIFQRFLAGEAMLAIAWDLQRCGVPTRSGRAWNQTVIRKMLANPAYAGGVRLRGEIVNRTAHESIVSWSDWETAQARLAQNPITRTKDRALASWCEGRIEHSCGRRMYLYGIRSVRRGHDQIPSFGCAASYGASTVRCTEPRRHIVVTKVEGAVRTCMSRDLSSVVSLRDAVDGARAAAGGRDAERARRALADRRRLAERRHDRARERWLQGKEPDAWMAQEDARFEADVAAIAKEASSIPSEPDPERLAQVAEQLASLAAVISEASTDALREALAVLGTAIVSGAGVQIRYHPDYATFISCPTVAKVPERKRSTIDE